MAVFCAAPGCGVIVERGRCHAHTRGSRHAQGYGNRWARRAAHFRTLYPLCGMRPGGLAPVMSRCHDEGRVTIAAQVDHVIPHKGNAALFWDELGNWQALCKACGARKSAVGL
jgi:5-methylcytosine-specific restriction protein A